MNHQVLSNFNLFIHICICRQPRPSLPYSGHIAYQFHSQRVTALILEYFASALWKKKKSNPNLIMVSPLSGPADPRSRPGLTPTPILVEPFSLITLGLLLLSWPLQSARCCYSKSALGDWFSLWTYTRPSKAASQ